RCGDRFDDHDDVLPPLRASGAAWRLSGLSASVTASIRPVTSWRIYIGWPTRYDGTMQLQSRRAGGPWTTRWTGPHLSRTGRTRRPSIQSPVFTCPATFA